MGVLTVYLDRVTNLVDDDYLGKSDPYVKFELEQDNLIFDHDYGTQRSTTKKDQISPDYDETFVFEHVPGLDRMVLKIKVMDDDPLFDDKIGSVNIKLEELGLNESPTGVDRVIDNHFFSKDARIFLRLSYQE